MNDVRASVTDDVMEARSTGGRDYFRVRRTVNFDVSETVPAEFFAVMRATYVPEWTEAPLFVRPSQETVAAPACNVTAGAAVLTIVPDGVSIREVTEAARVSSNCATTRARRRGTESAGGTALRSRAWC